MRSTNLDAQEYFTCPTCGSVNPVILHETKWCESCDYGLFPLDNSKTDSIFQKEIKKLGRKHSMRLFQDLTELKVQEPRQTANKLASKAIALAVHSISLGSILCGITLFYFWPQPFAIFGSVIFLIFGYLSFPWKLGTWPKDDVIPSTNSTLYNVTKRISDQLASADIDGLLINDEFNAYYTEIGWKKRRLIALGMPLLESLSDAEIVAIIAHEVAHGINGDVKRGVVVVTAVRSLNFWYSLLAPNSWTEGAGQTPLGPLVMIPINAGRLLIAQVPRLISIILSRLIMRDSQEAEYLADMKAAQAAGTDNMVSALTALHRREAQWSQAVRSAAISHEKINIFDTVFRDLPQSSDREWARRQKAEEKNGLSFDATHPPVGYRIAYLKKCGEFQPSVLLSAEEGRALRDELRKHHVRISESVIDKYRTWIY